MMSANTELREQVRARYAQAATAVTTGTRNADLLVEETPVASCCSPTAAEDTDADSCCAPTERSFGAGLYDEATAAGLPLDAVEASLGCGNPTAVAELHEGERVLDLRSGGGIDVLLSARRVGKSGFAYGVDMTDEMLAVAEAGAENAEFPKGTIEDVSLPDGSDGMHAAIIRATKPAN